MLRPHLRRPPTRAGAAAAEFAVVMTFVMVPMLIGLWEMGRLVHVQQIVANAAREGARLAAQGVTTSASGAQTQIVTSIPPPNTAGTPNVKAAVMQSLYGAGLDRLRYSDVDVTFQFLDGPTASTEPWQGVKNQRLRVTVTVQFSKVRWVNLGLVNPATVTYSADWQMLVDDPFQVNTDLPNPFHPVASKRTW